MKKLEARSQFTFYLSFFESISRIKSKAVRADAYDALCKYALYGIEPELDTLPDAAAIAFVSSKPNLDASRRKAESGKRGGSSKQTESNSEANAKQNKANGKQTESEKEKEGENEKEKENECYIPPVCVPLADDTPQAKPEKHKRGQYGWVRLTDDEYSRLVGEYGAEATERAIAYVDEAAQSTGNKNKWKDWNLTVRRCIRDEWGQRAQPPQPTADPYAGFEKIYDEDGNYRWERKQ